MTVNRWVLGSSAQGTGALMPRDCKQNGFLVGVPIRHVGFHAVSIVNRWVLGSGALDTGTDMLS